MCFVKVIWTMIFGSEFLRLRTPDGTRELYKKILSLVKQEPWTVVNVC